jgi:hypothetical protein
MIRGARHRVVAALAAVALALVVAPRAALAYARTRTEAGKAAAWRSPRLVLHVPVIGPDRPVAELTSEEVLAASDAAVALWSHAQVDCTAAQLWTVADAPRGALVGNDKLNTLIFRDDSWSPTSFDEDGKPLGDYEPNQLALTSAFVRASGEIVDADIEINAFNHPTWVVSGDPITLLEQGAIDLQNTLSHEVGHVLGFDHSCWDPVNGPQPLNGDKPLTPCADDPELAQATMAPTAPPGDVNKRVLHADDRRALCEVYPFDTGGGCAVAPARPALTAFASLAALVAAAVFRRPGRRAGSCPPAPDRRSRRSW